MSKQVFDVIQRLEVEDGIPRVISSTINLIEGGVDLLSQARTTLKELDFADKFEENKTAQYIGYRPKRTTKGIRRYSLVLFQRKDGLLISFPQEFLKLFTLELTYCTYDHDNNVVYSTHDLYWVRPSQEDLFLDISKNYWEHTKGEVAGHVNIDPPMFDPETFDWAQEGTAITSVGNFYLCDHTKYFEELRDSSYCLEATSDTLFPYCRQFFITSSDVLDELLAYFVPKLMEM